MSTQTKKILNFTSQHGDKEAAAVEQELFDRTAALASQVFQAAKDRDTPVLKYSSPDQIKKAIDIKVAEEPACVDELMEQLHKVVEYSVKTGHPHFFNQLFAGADAVGIAAEWMTAALNTSIYTFEMAPVFAQMEEEILNKMAGYMGFTDGEGICCPGGSYSNIVAIHTARNHYGAHKINYDIRKQGHAGRKLCFLTGEHAHYSMLKASLLLGLGEDNCVKVKCDARARMCPVDLQEKITALKAEGREPFCVVATCGYTVSGAFDPVETVADICEKEDIWLHIDAAWGGGMLCSKRERVKLQGVHRAQSLTWNPHKLMNAPQQVSAVFINKQKGLLKEASAAFASYLFQPDKMYTEYDTGDASLQCGRRPDIFKLWLMWKARGSEGFEAHIDHIMDCANYLKEQILAREEFRLVFDNQCTNVGFFWLPKDLRDGKLNKQTGAEASAKLDDHEMFKEKELYDRMHKLSCGIKRRMQTRGTTLCAYQPLAGLPNFFRMVVINCRVTKQDMDFLLDEICICAEEVESGL